MGWSHYKTTISWFAIFSQQPNRGQSNKTPSEFCSLKAPVSWVPLIFNSLPIYNTKTKQSCHFSCCHCIFPGNKQSIPCFPCFFNLSFYPKSFSNMAYFIFPHFTFSSSQPNVISILLSHYWYFLYILSCRRVNASLSRRHLLSIQEKGQCRTGNPIDDCWKCDSNWANNRQRLADCAIGFGQGSLGGRGGQIYVVTDSSDQDPANPKPGTLRYGVIQDQPLWIIFSSNMVIKLKHELIFNSYKTIDGRGANVHITGNGCITLQYISHIIIHNIHVHHCKPSGNTNIAASPTHVGWRGRSDGDGISIFGAQKIWIDHCSLSYCTDGLIDAIMGSTGITISNSHFTHHDEVMLLGHDDKYALDTGMQVTIAFNHFGQGLVQRMPRCRRGYIHVVNNDFTAWEMYAIGGSASPTINSQGNRYTAPTDDNAKEVSLLWIISHFLWR